MENIQVYIDGVVADISNAEVRLEEKYSLFKEDILQDSYSFPLKFPWTDVNRRIFETVHEYAVDRKLKYNCQIVYGGSSIVIDGQLNIIGFSAKTGVSASVSYGAVSIGDLDKELPRFKFDTLYFDDVEDLQDEITDVLYERNWENKICFPLVNNGGFYGSDNEDYSGYINSWDLATGQFKINDSGVGTAYTAVPMPYVFYVLKKVFETYGFTIEGEWWNDDRMKGLATYNNVSLDTKQSRYQAKVGIEQNIFEDNSVTSVLSFWTDTGSSSDVWDYFIQDGVIDVANNIWIDKAAADGIVLSFNIYFSNKMGSESGGLNYFRIYKNDVLLGAIAINGGVTSFQYNFILNGTGGLDEYKFKLYRPNLLGNYNTGIIDTSRSYLSVKISTAETYNVFKNQISIANHVWDVKAIEFIKYWIKVFMLDAKVNLRTKKVIFDYKKSIINKNTKFDITDIVDGVPETIIDTKTLKTNYTFSDNDRVLKDFKQSKIDGYYDRVPEDTEYGADGSFVLERSTNFIRLGKKVSSPGIFEGVLWSTYGNFYPDKVYGNGADEDYIEISPMMMSYAYSSEIICLGTNERGNSELFSGSNNSYHKRFFFYEGYGKNYAGTSKYYGFGHSTGRYTNGDFVTNSPINLSYTEELGMWEEFLKPIYDILTKYAETEFKIKISSADIQNLRDADVLLYKNMKYYAKSNSLRITKSGVEAVLKTILPNG
jgi:hypothetical protein